MFESFSPFVGRSGDYLGVSVRQAEKIATVVKAANVKVESYWPTLFAKLLEKRSVEDLILSVGSGIPPSSL